MSAPVEFIAPIEAPTGMPIEAPKPKAHKAKATVPETIKRQLRADGPLYRGAPVGGMRLVRRHPDYPGAWIVEDADGVTRVFSERRLIALHEADSDGL